MKRFFLFTFALVTLLASCDKKPLLYNVNVQLKVDGAEAAIADIAITLTDGTSEYTANSDQNGAATFTVAEGSYTVTATGKFFIDGERIAYNGTATVAVMAETSVNVELLRSKSNQIIIKELYTGGCPDNAGTKVYANDAYVVLYNNSESDVDASNIVFAMAAPYNGQGTNKYYTGESLSYENADWIPSIGAIWWFTSKVTIPAYSQIVVAIFGAIDHTATYTNSVNLSNSSYYWMSNTDVAAYTMAKYAVSDAIPATNYLTCSPFSKGTAWAFSTSSPALYIGRMDSATALSLSQDSANYDLTLGTNAAFYVVKFPKANVVDAVEVFQEKSISTSKPRFSADINSGYVAFTNQQGYTIYRNVDKAATEALEENAGKIVYNYAGGTADIGGTTDPSGIDAEASIKAGAHIIYSDTNNSGTDFHQRKVSSLK